MLPLSLLKCATGYKVLLELKNGDTYNGELSSIDLFMNIALSNAVRTSHDGATFWRVSETYIRGNTIKYVRVPEEVLDAAAEDRVAREAARNRGKGNRNRPSARGGNGKEGRDGGRMRNGGRKIGGRMQQSRG